jgi:hypothetical protein
MALSSLHRHDVCTATAGRESALSANIRGALKATSHANTGALQLRQLQMCSL